MFHVVDRSKLVHLGTLIVLLVLVLVALRPVPVQAQNPQDDGLGTPKFKNEPLGKAVQKNATTIPFWSDSFAYAGQTYPYMMVGTDPMLGGGTSSVPTEILPMRFVFADGNVLDGSTKTSLTIGSPIFQSASFASGTTQYGDAIQRAEFWTTGGSSANYHVLLGQPAVLPTETINVPKNQGLTVIGRRSGAVIGLMSYSWFSAQLKNLLGQRHIDPRTTPIFLTYNTFLYEGSVGNCCVLGYHGATSSANGNGTQPIQTYIYAAYSDPNIFGSPYIQDIHGLSHEVSEWMNDPFVNNIVPPWSVPTAPQYGCTNYLETGDPVVGIGFAVTVNGTTYHPEDEVYFSWFARESPSRALNGYYTYMNTFSTVAPGC